MRRTLPQVLRCTCTVPYSRLSTTSHPSPRPVLCGLLIKLFPYHLLDAHDNGFAIFLTVMACRAASYTVRASGPGCSLAHNARTGGENHNNNSKHLSRHIDMGLLWMLQRDDVSKRDKWTARAGRRHGGARYNDRRHVFVFLRV